MKEKILNYLQKNALYLNEKFPSLLDACLDGDHMLLVFEKEVPKNVHEVLKNLDFKIKSIVGDLDTNNIISTENDNLKAWKKRYEKYNNNELVSSKTEEAINPNSKNVKNIESYEAWKKRYTKVN